MFSFEFLWKNKEELHGTIYKHQAVAKNSWKCRTHTHERTTFISLFIVKCIVLGLLNMSSCSAWFFHWNKSVDPNIFHFTNFGLVLKIDSIWAVGSIPIFHGENCRCSENERKIPISKGENCLKRTIFFLVFS